MSNRMRTLAATLLCGGSIALMANGASATPATHALAIKNAVPGQVEAVRWGGRGWGWGGFAAGAIIGGALAAPYYGGYYGGYYPAPYYGAPYPAPYPAPGYYGGGPAGGGDVAYCMQRYRSYEPQSGTFLGFDGARHPCP
jgi:BA14K-like protein